MPSIAIFGLGIIGGVWAGHHEADGRLRAAWNRSPRPAAPLWEPDAAVAARRADALQIVVADPAAVEAVLDRVLPLLRPGQLVIQSSTIDPASAARGEERVRRAGGLYVEAPFTGSKPAAEQRKTVFYLGGEPRAKEAAEALLAPVSTARFDCGGVQQAAALKLSFNLQLAAMMEALAESLAFARASGLSDELYFAAMRQNAAWSGLSALKEPKLRAGDWSPQFSVKHMLKDVRLALAAAPQGLQLPGTVCAESALAAEASAGRAELDYSVLLHGRSARGLGRSLGKT